MTGMLVGNSPLVTRLKTTFRLYAMWDRKVSLLSDSVEKLWYELGTFDTTSVVLIIRTDDKYRYCVSPRTSIAGVTVQYVGWFGGITALVVILPYLNANAVVAAND